VEEIGVVDGPFIYEDQATAVRALTSAGPLQAQSKGVGKERHRAALAEALAPYRRPDASYRLENKFVFMVARR
jgi:hypothetical protein